MIALEKVFASWIWRKAYDLVSWEFWMYNAEMSGLWQPMVLVDSKCISSPIFSVLCNGVEEVFESFRGYEAGGSIVKFLFVLVMEGFEALGEGLISLFKVGNACNDVSISHLLSIDDPVNFVDNDMQPFYT